MRGLIFALTFFFGFASEAGALSLGERVANSQYFTEQALDLLDAAAAPAEAGAAHVFCEYAASVKMQAENARTWLVSSREPAQDTEDFEIRQSLQAYSQRLDSFRDSLNELGSACSGDADFTKIRSQYWTLLTNHHEPVRLAAKRYSGKIYAHTKHRPLKGGGRVPASIR